jgi:16S rRNA (uracil1498-N3)-methyltransferase
MRLHRFFIPASVPSSGDFTVTDENLLNQWRNVLRMDVGDTLVAFDGRGEEAVCTLVQLEKKSAVLSVAEYRKGIIPTREITLFMALIKRDNFELVLQKATELGVSRIVPLQTARSEKKGVNRERSEKILREATEQSGRTTVPVLDSEVRLVDVVKNYQIPLVAFDPRGTLAARDAQGGILDKTGIIIGPEGGFTEEEISFFEEHQIPIVCTGKTILRAETAALVALALALTQ